MLTELIHLVCVCRNLQGVCQSLLKALSDNLCDVTSAFVKMPLYIIYSIMNNNRLR